jgi:hypothetical protein
MEPESQSSPPPRPEPPTGRETLVRSDGSHVRAAVHDELYDSPAYELGCRDPLLLEKLGELDDVVFEAIAGRAAAVDRLQVLWPEVLSLVGPDLAEESREAYLRHAMSKWRECAEAEEHRNPRLAVTLMDVLAILIRH